MKHPALLGAFVIGALLIALAAIFALGGPAFFEKKLDCIAYFEDNISGLDVGAPVEYQGVKIGSVTDVRLECDLSTLQFARPVRFRLDTRSIHYTGTTLDATSSDFRETLVRSHGLRAQLASQSLLTGKLKITLTHDPDSPVNLANRDDDDDAFEIPTIPTPLSVAAKKLSDLPLAEILSDIRSSLAGLSSLINSPELSNSVTRASAALSAATDTLSTAGDTFAAATDTLGILRDRLPPLLDSLDTASGSVAATADSVTATLAPDSPQSRMLADTLADLQDAARSLRLFLDFIEQHPDALLRGKNEN